MFDHIITHIFRNAKLEGKLMRCSKWGYTASRNPFSSPVHLVKKKDGNLRFCVNFCALNSIFLKDRFPLLIIDEILDELRGTKWFSKLDLRQGFHQKRRSEAHIHKTAFRTHMGHYEYKVMPFGLCNTPSTYEWFVEPILAQMCYYFLWWHYDL